jgi:hypothetical protein
MRGSIQNLREARISSTGWLRLAVPDILRNRMDFSDCTGAFCGRHFFKSGADFTHDVIQKLLVAVIGSRGSRISPYEIADRMSSHEPLSHFD